MFFLTPRYVKLGRQFVKDARKLVAYKRDIVSAEVVAEVEKEIAALDAAVKARDKAAVEKQAETLDKVCGKLVKPTPDAWWRENVEVFLVAIVVALGVRTYYLQPFTIPTSSMFPTLNGIIFEETKEEPPNILLRLPQGVLYGRHYVNLVAKEREQVVALRPAKSLLPFISHVPGLRFGPFNRTEIVTQSESGRERSYFVAEAPETVDANFSSSVWGGRVYEPGDPILRGYFNAGDHVFVDKVSYHFRRPTRGETFVFSTADIPKIKALTPGGQSQYYIKRLAGVPGDNLRIQAPDLYINGQRATEPGFVRVMQGTPKNPVGSYRGYGNTFNQDEWDQPTHFTRTSFLQNSEQSLTLAPREYFALGDNSYNSSDGRVWGVVPEKALMGRAFMVYWPFLPHFGLAK